MPRSSGAHSAHLETLSLLGERKNSVSKVVSILCTGVTVCVYLHSHANVHTHADFKNSNSALSTCSVCSTSPCMS